MFEQDLAKKAYVPLVAAISRAGNMVRPGCAAFHFMLSIPTTTTFSAWPDRQIGVHRSKKLVGEGASIAVDGGTNARSRLYPPPASNEIHSEVYVDASPGASVPHSHAQTLAGSTDCGSIT